MEIEKSKRERERKKKRVNKARDVDTLVLFWLTLFCFCLVFVRSTTPSLEWTLCRWLLSRKPVLNRELEGPGVLVLGSAIGEPVEDMFFCACNCVASYCPGAVFKIVLLCCSLEKFCLLSLFVL